MNIALVTASGSGMRMGANIPKQFLPLDGEQVIDKSVKIFLSHQEIDFVIVTLGKEQYSYWRSLDEYLKSGRIKVVNGGLSRQDSVYNGLRFAKSLAADCEEDISNVKILVHDGARPNVTHELIDKVLNGFSRDRGIFGAVPIINIKDSIIDAVTLQALDRENVKAVQTPQGFYLEMLLDSFEKAYADDFSGTDESSIAQQYGVNFELVLGDERNLKLTTKEDMFYMSKLYSAYDDLNSLGGNAPYSPVKVGTGYDVHQLVEGRPLILGGVNIPFERGLLGHSDADVLVHSLMDALLGAMGLGDIGMHFPDSDQRYKGVSSLQLLEEVALMMKRNRYVLSNCDVTVICQRPKIAGYIDEMKSNIASVLNCQKCLINIKGTTTEGLGFEGQGQGIAAMATVCIYKLPV